jgi:translation initiation factor IF-1
MISNYIKGTNTNLNKTVTTSPTTPSQVSTSQNLTIGLEKGQIIGGEVTDLHNKEVSVKLEDGRLLTGKIEDTGNLAIGDKVTFRVEDVSLKSLTLKLIPNNTQLMQDTTIDKALDAAGLSRNTRNRAIVNELLKNQMSIDKKTISQLIQQSILHKDVPIDTLVLLNKHQIPITEANLKQYSSYSNMEHSILDEMTLLANDLTELLSQPEANTTTLLGQQTKNLLKLLLPDSSTIANTLSKEDSLEVLKLIDKNPLLKTILGDQMMQSLQDGTTNIRDIAQVINNLLNIAKNSTFNTNSLYEDNLKQNIIDTNISNQNFNNQNINNQNEIEITNYNQTTGNNQLTQGQNNQNNIEFQILNLKESPITDSILNKAQTLENTPGSNQSVNINSFLNSEQREKLLGLLDNNKLSEDIKNQIKTGDITTNDLLKFIKENLSKETDTYLKDLLTSSEFKELLKQDLLSKWTITPEMLKEDNSILNKHYTNMLNQLNGIKDLLNQTPSDLSNAISAKASNLQDNISFMNNINQMFTYVQIPVKLKSQHTNSELYIYSRKGQKSIEEGIKVLLHLDMDHLGPMDIFIELRNQSIQSKFYLNSEETITLISSQITLLEQALNKKGYQLNSEFLKREKEIYPIEEFTKQEDSNPETTRYNFDLRA